MRKEFNTIIVLFVFVLSIMSVSANGDVVVCIDDYQCDDGDACNGDETCSGGFCDYGTPLVCNDGNFCTMDSCNPASGCENIPEADGTVCDDYQSEPYCDGGFVKEDVSICSAGACVPQPSVLDNCNDGNEDSCHGDFWIHATESCSEVDGARCVALSSTGNCNNYDYCDGIETCEGEGVCTNPADVVCDQYPLGAPASCYDTVECEEGNDDYICDYDSNKLPDTDGPVVTDVVIDPVYNNGYFNLDAQAEDECSAIKEAEYYVGQGTAGCYGTPFAMEAEDLTYDELVEMVEKYHYNSPVTIQDGQNFVCVKAYDTGDEESNCACMYFESDLIPPERIIEITLNGVENQ